MTRQTHIATQQHLLVTHRAPKSVTKIHRSRKDKKHFKGIPNCSQGKDLEQVSAPREIIRYSLFLILSVACCVAMQIIASFFLPRFPHCLSNFTV